MLRETLGYTGAAVRFICYIVDCSIGHAPEKGMMMMMMAEAPLCYQVVLLEIGSSQVYENSRWSCSPYTDPAHWHNHVRSQMFLYNRKDEFLCVLKLLHWS